MKKYFLLKNGQIGTHETREKIKVSIKDGKSVSESFVYFEAKSFKDDQVERELSEKEYVKFVESKEKEEEKKALARLKDSEKLLKSKKAALKKLGMSEEEAEEFLK